MGSATTLYWLLRQLPAARGIGFERDDLVFRWTRRNLDLLGLPIEILNTDYTSGLAELSVPGDRLMVAFIALPWGDALDRASGLDLRRSMPPIAEIVDLLARCFGAQRLLCAIQVHETVVPASLAELRPRLDWSSLRVHGLNAAGTITASCWAPAGDPGGRASRSRSLTSL